MVKMQESFKEHSLKSYAATSEKTSGEIMLGSTHMHSEKWDLICRAYSALARRKYQVPAVRKLPSTGLHAEKQPSKISHDEALQTDI